MPTDLTSENPLARAVLDVSAECFTSMAGILTVLGDDLANRRPDLPGANSCYAIVNHCIGVVDYWAGSFIAGQRIPRDRDSEFTATGRVDELLERLMALQQRFPAWVEVAVTEGIRARSVSAGVRGGTTRAAALSTATPEWALLHILHDIAQHVGHLEITRDLLMCADTER